MSNEPSSIRYTLGSAGLWGSAQFLCSLHQGAATKASVESVLQQAKSEGLKGARLGALAGFGASHIAQRAYRVGERRGKVLVAKEKLPLSGSSLALGAVSSALAGFGLGSGVASLPSLGKDLVKRSVAGFLRKSTSSVPELVMQHIKTPHLRAGFAGAGAATIAFQSYLAGTKRPFQNNFSQK